MPQVLRERIVVVEEREKLRQRDEDPLDVIEQDARLGQDALLQRERAVSPEAERWIRSRGHA